jgi:hypothetical protein
VSVGGAVVSVGGGGRVSVDDSLGATVVERRVVASTEEDEEVMLDVAGVEASACVELERLVWSGTAGAGCPRPIRSAAVTKPAVRMAASANPMSSGLRVRPRRTGVVAKTSVS